VLNGDTPKNELKVASHGSLSQQIRPTKKSVKIVLNKKKPSGKSSPAGSDLRKQLVATKQQMAPKQQTAAAMQQVKLPRKFLDSKFDPYGIGPPRRLSRRERLQLYYSGRRD
jgi:negative regulator of genetic competence, sporulation and motility